MLRRFSLFIAPLIFSGMAFSQDISIPKTEAELRTSINALKWTTIPQLRETHACMVQAESIVKNYSAMKKMLLSKEASEGKTLAIHADSFDLSSADLDYNVYRNFDGNGQYQDQFFAILTKFAATYAFKETQSLETIRAEISRIDQGQFDLSQELLVVAPKDQIYLAILDQVKSHVQKVYKAEKSRSARLFQKPCDQINFAPTVGFIDQDVRKVIDSISQLRNFTLQGIEKRNKIVRELIAAVRSRYVDRYQEIAVRDLGISAAAARETLELSYRGEKMIRWWQDINTAGLGLALHTKYLRYEAPLSILVTEKKRGSDFEKEIKSLTNAPEDMKNVYLSKLALFQKSLDENIAILMSRGWKGQLERQILLNKKRRLSASQLSNECLLHLDRHLEAASLVSSIEAFRNLENLYKTSLDVCSARG